MKCFLLVLFGLLSFSNLVAQTGPAIPPLSGFDAHSFSIRGTAPNPIPATVLRTTDLWRQVGSYNPNSASRLAAGILEKQVQDAISKWFVSYYTTKHITLQNGGWDKHCLTLSADGTAKETAIRSETGLWEGLTILCFYYFDPSNSLVFRLIVDGQYADVPKKPDDPDQIQNLSPKYAEKIQQYEQVLSENLRQGIEGAY